jgi:hypothetical protein
MRDRRLLISAFSCVLLLVSLSPAYAQTAALSVIEQCAALLPDDRPVETGADAPSIRFVTPTDGGMVYAGEVIVSVETENFDIESAAAHWHLWVNGRLMGMLYQASGVIDLEPGTYQLCASMGDTNHMDLGMPAGITITVQQPAAGTAIPTLAISREEAPIIPEPESSPMQIVLIVGLGLVAAVGGWWLGTRLPKRGKPKQ